MRGVGVNNGHDMVSMFSEILSHVNFMIISNQISLLINPQILMYCWFLDIT